MGLTLQIGISAYLENFLRAYSDTQLQMPKLHKQYKDYLLLYACYSYASIDLYDAAIRPMKQVMVQLLNIGADPNAKLFPHPSLPNMTTPGSTLLITEKQRMMTTNFCELFWHFLEKWFRLEDPEFDYHTVYDGWFQIADYLDHGAMDEPGLLSQATRHRRLVSSWEMPWCKYVQILPYLTAAKQSLISLKWTSFLCGPGTLRITTMG